VDNKAMEKTIAKDHFHPIKVKSSERLFSVDNDDEKQEGCQPVKRERMRPGPVIKEGRDEPQRQKGRIATAFPPEKETRPGKQKDEQDARLPQG
jgi:hypothetical protein